MNLAARRALWSEGVVTGVILLLLALLLAASGVLAGFNQRLYDAGLRLWSQPATDNIAIVAVDDRSLAALGPWPWSRRIHADLLNRVSQAGPKAIGLDMIFSEPALSDPESDQALAQAIRSSHRVILAIAPNQLRAEDTINAAEPLPLLAGAAAGLGHVDIVLDRDRVVRSVFMLAGPGSPQWPALPLAMLELGEGYAWPDLPGERQLTAQSSAANAWVRDYRVLIPYAGPPGHFQRYSFVDVLRDPAVAAQLKGRLVLVGLIATDLVDTYATPVSSGARTAMARVEILANLLDGVRRGVAAQRIGRGWDLALTVLLVLPVLLYPLLRPREGLLLLAALLPAQLLCSLILLLHFHLWFGPVPALFTTVLSYPLWNWRGINGAVRGFLRERGRARATLQSIGDAVITTDAKGVVEFMNPVAETMTGFSRTEARGERLQNIFELLDEDERPEGIDMVARALDEGQVIKLSRYRLLRNRNGLLYAVRVSASPMSLELGRARGVVLAFSDISETVAMTRQIAHQATHDALTGLPNRNLLEQRIEDAIAHAQGSGGLLAVLFLDLDGFKKVNDGMGHTTGDELLKLVAGRLRAISRAVDTVARWGGDEFVILIEHLRDRDESAATVAQKVIHALAAPYELDGQELYITASIGISLFPKDGLDSKDLLKKADIAMYRGKEQGRNTYQYYSDAGNTGAMLRLVLEKDLRHALKGRRLDLLFQPQLSLNGGGVFGTEALIRWLHPDHGLVAPETFVRLAEDTGLISALGEWALRTACEQARAWRELGLPAVPVSVNLSPRQFLQRGFGDRVAGILAENNIGPDTLKLEITEGLFMQDTDRIMDILSKLRDLGVGFAIDDFGTGYSSLSYLKRLPIDQIKIDKSFVRDITTDPDDAAIVRAVIAMAHGLKLDVVAEGAETLEQYQFLKAQSCDALQGYYYSRPLPAGDMGALLARSLDPGQQYKAS